MLRFALSGLAAAGVFVVVNHVLLAIMLRLGRGHSIRATGLFSASGLGVELVIAVLGACNRHVRDHQSRGCFRP